MNEMFSQGGKGSTGILTNKQAIARKFGVLQSEVIYFSAGVDLGGYKVIYDKTTQRSYSISPVLPSGTIAALLNQAGVLTHSTGSVDLGEVAVSRGEYVTLSGSFTTGQTLTVKNELLSNNNSTYRWAGTYPKVVPSGSTPESTGGIGIGAWVGVGDAALRGQLASGMTGSGDALIAVKQPFTGSIDRTQHNKNAEVVSLTDAAIGDGVTNDTSAVNAAIASFGTSGGTLLIPKNINGAEKKYLIADGGVINPYGVKLVGDGAIVSVSPNGGLNQINSYGNGFRISYGQEYLYRIYKRFELGQQAQVFLHGDSTVSGGNGESPAFSTGTLVSTLLASAGLDCNVINRGVGGTSWYQMNAIPDLSATSDLLIIKYGINDGGTPGAGDRLANFAAAMRSKLAEIRANAFGGIHNLSIILVGPNSTNDTQHNRDAVWYEKLQGIYLQAARDFQCAYFDTYGYMIDVKNAAGYSMDNPFGNGQGVHPMNTMQAWIWGKVIDTYFSNSMIEEYKNNVFTNIPSSSGSPNVATALINYRRGVTIYRAKTTDGWPLDSAVVTVRSADDVGYQTVFGFGTSSKSMRRTWNISTSAWNQWTGQAVGLAPASSWVATAVPSATISADGMVNISAYLTGGTTTTGTQILTGLPVAFRPAVEKRFAVANDNGSLTCVGVSSSGNIFLVGSTTSSAGVHVHVSYYV